MVIIFGPFAFYIYNFRFYDGLYTKNSVYETLDKEDVKKLTINLFDYLKYKKDFEPFKLKGGIEFFNSNEISHLDDVRLVFKNILIIFYISLFLFLITCFLLFEKNYPVFFKNISLVAVISSSAMLFLLALLYFFGNNFIPLFENMHYVLFPQGNWSFPEGSLLITLLPFGFFYDFFFKLLTASLIISVALIIAGITGIIISSRIIKKIMVKEQML